MNYLPLNKNKKISQGKDLHKEKVDWEDEGGISKIMGNENPIFSLNK